MSAAAAAEAAVSAAMVDDLFAFDDEPTPAATAVVATKKTASKKKDGATSSGKKKGKGKGRKKKGKKGTKGKKTPAVTSDSESVPTKTKKKKKHGAATSADPKKGKKKKTSTKKGKKEKTGKTGKTSTKKGKKEKTGKSRFVDDEAAVDGTAGDDEDDDEDAGSMDDFIDDDDVSDGGGPAPYLGDEEPVETMAARATETMRPAQRAAAPANARPKKATKKLHRQQTMEAVMLTSEEQAAKTDVTKWAMLPAIMDALATKKRQNPDITFLDTTARGMIQKMMTVAEYVLTKKFANATPEEVVGLLSIPTQSIQMATADAFQTIQKAIRVLFPDKFTLDSHFFPVASAMLATLFHFKSVTIDEIPDGAAPICQWTGDELTVGQSVYLCAYYRKTTTGSTVRSFYISHHTKYAPLYMLFIHAARGMHRWVWAFALSLLEWQRTMSVPKEATDEVRIKRFIADDKNVPFAVANAVMNYFEAMYTFSKISLTP